MSTFDPSPELEPPPEDWSDPQCMSSSCKMWSWRSRITPEREKRPNIPCQILGRMDTCVRNIDDKSLANSETAPTGARTNNLSQYFKLAPSTFLTQIAALPSKLLLVLIFSWFPHFHVFCSLWRKHTERDIGSYQTRLLCKQISNTCNEVNDQETRGLPNWRKGLTGKTLVVDGRIKSQNL